MVKNYQEEQALKQPQPEAARLATVYDWWSDGLQLIFDGEAESDMKHYPCNANHWFDVGDRVLVQKVGGSYVVICKIGGPSNDDRYRVANIVKNNAPGIADLEFYYDTRGTLWFRSTADQNNQWTKLSGGTTGTPPKL